MTWLGLDIGGANIKAASTEGTARSVPFRFWIEHRQLKNSLAEIIGEFPQCKVAATMTAELADCFESRQQGVNYIVDCLVDVCEDVGLAEPVFAGTDLEFRDAEQAKGLWLKTAASNWAMMAAFAARYLPDQTGVVIDMGSTTTDIIPVHHGQIAAKGRTDSERFRNGELVYVGADRTPVCSVVSRFQHDGKDYPAAAELFATVGDAMLLCGVAQEDPSRCDTADGRPRTAKHAAQRICRMACEDVETVGMEAAQMFAQQVLSNVAGQVTDTINRLMNTSDFKNIIVTGSGVNFIKPKLESMYPEVEITSLDRHVNGEVNSVAPAWAVAVLASERTSS